MKISQLISLLQTEKRKWGDLSVIFSQDEEGNAFSNDCFVDFYGDDTIAVYPCGERLTPQ